MENDVKEIFSYLEYIRSKDRMVSIVSGYKGVSFSNIVNIIDISLQEMSIVISSLPKNHISILPNTEVEIHSDIFPQPVHAKVSSIDFKRKSAVLFPHEYKQGSADNRTQPRIRSKGDIPISIQGEDDFQIVANLSDVSLIGLSAMIKDMTFEMKGKLIEGHSYNLKFELQLSGDSSPTRFDLTSKIIYVSLQDEDQYRVGFYTYPKPGDTISLRRYIFDRQTELLQEISTELSKPALH